MDPMQDTPPGPIPGEGLKVLVIDDEEFLAETLAEGLEKVGYQCKVATSSAAVKQRAASSALALVSVESHQVRAHTRS